MGPINWLALVLQASASAGGAAAPDDGPGARLSGHRQLTPDCSRAYELERSPRVGRVRDRVKRCRHARSLNKLALLFFCRARLRVV